MRDITELSREELKELESEGKVKVSWRQEHSNYSSGILLSYFKKYKNTLSVEYSVILERYKSLYLSYVQKCYETLDLSAYIRCHEKSINPFVIRKRKKMKLSLQIKNKKYARI